MASARSVGRILLLALGVVLVGAFGLAILLAILGLTMAGVCVALSDPNCPSAPTFAAIEVEVEPTDDTSAVLIVRGERDPSLPDDYVAQPQVRVQDVEDAQLQSADAGTNTYRVLVPRAPQPGASTALSVVLTFGPRTGIADCKERGQGHSYDTRIDLTLLRSPAGTLEVADVRHRHAHGPSYF